MTLRLHWSPRSPFVRKVMICAYELGVEDRLELTRSVAAMLVPNPAIMRDNPLSKLPTLVLEDGSALFDSAVICEYLNDRFDGDLLPVRGRQRWSVLRWQALGNGWLDALVLWRNERERPEGKVLEPMLDAFAVKHAAVLDRLEQEAPNLASAPFGLGHITVGCALGYLDFRFAQLDWRKAAPQLAAWYAEVSQRPSFAQTVPDAINGGQTPFSKKGV